MVASESVELSGFAASLGLTFDDPGLLEKALTHPSASSGARGARPSYQRLEWLGDRVLGLVLADRLYRAYPDEEEGPLARRMAALASEPSLVRVARGIDLGRYLIVDAGEERNRGRETAANLADACEAVWKASFNPLAWRLAEQGMRYIGRRRDLTWFRLCGFDLARREAAAPDAPGIPLDAPERTELAQVVEQHLLVAHDLVDLHRERVPARIEDRRSGAGADHEEALGRRDVLAEHPIHVGPERRNGLEGRPRVHVHRAIGQATRDRVGTVGEHLDVEIGQQVTIDVDRVSGLVDELLVQEQPDRGGAYQGPIDLPLDE